MYVTLDERYVRYAFQNGWINVDHILLGKSDYPREAKVGQVVAKSMSFENPFCSSSTHVSYFLFPPF